MVWSLEILVAKDGNQLVNEVGGRNIHNDAHIVQLLSIFWKEDHNIEQWYSSHFLIDKVALSQNDEQLIRQAYYILGKQEHDLLGSQVGRNNGRHPEALEARIRQNLRQIPLDLEIIQINLDNKEIKI